MEELALLLLQVLFEGLGTGLFEVVWELVSATYKRTYGRPNHHPVVAACGYFLIGLGLGSVSLLLWPSRVFRGGPVPGLSLVLTPLALGFAMHAWGQYRRERGRVTTNLASFLGGAAFAFGTALARFLWAD